jgi:hypothetical protein
MSNADAVLAALRLADNATQSHEDFTEVARVLLAEGPDSGDVANREAMDLIIALHNEGKIAFVMEGSL